MTLAEIGALARDETRHLTIFCVGEPGDCAAMVEEFGVGATVVADPQGEVMRLFEVPHTPMAVRLSREGRVESYGEPARGDDLAELIRQFEHEHTGAEEHQEQDAAFATSNDSRTDGRSRAAELRLQR